MNRFVILLSVLTAALMLAATAGAAEPLKPPPKTKQFQVRTPCYDFSKSPAAIGAAKKKPPTLPTTTRGTAAAKPPSCVAVWTCVAEYRQKQYLVACKEVARVRPS